MANHFKFCQNILGSTLCTNSSNMADSILRLGLWVFYSELLHQSGVMFIQPPPLLCQPWTGLISSGSSRPLSFPSLLHISFKHVLLEDSNLEQSNIVQGVHIAVVLRLMKMLDSAAFYTLSGVGPYSWYTLDIRVTFPLALPVREFGTVCHVACEHLTSATNILKRY